MESVVLFSLGLVLINAPSPMLIAVGMYLPLETTSAIFVGGCIKALLHWFMRRRQVTGDDANRVESTGTLLASGFIAGESLTGVLLAAIVLAKAGMLTSNFPHAIGSFSLAPDDAFYSSFGGTPFMDDYLVDLAISLIEGEDLGRDDAVDFLSLSFSALDSAGHDYGPNSREALDVMLRLDRSLGRLFAYLDERIGMAHVMLSLSADHGVMTMPEALPVLGLLGRRVDASDVVCYQKSQEDFQMHFGRDEWFIEEMYLNYETLGRRNLLRSTVEKRLAESLERCAAVEKVWTSTELESQSPDLEQNEYLRLYRNSHHPVRSPDLYVQLKPLTLNSLGTETTHGSPYEYDRHVAMLIRVPGVHGRRIADRVRTLDLAPTLAGLLGIAAPPDLEGADWSRRLVPLGVD